MSSSNPSKDAKPGLFTVYKPGQGKYVRWGTVAGLSLIAITGAIWILHIFSVSAPPVRAGAVVVWSLVWAIGIFLVVNNPRLAEFFIMTEVEMRKVAWPTRKDVLGSTKVVILLTVLLAVMLTVVDLGFMFLFHNVMKIS